MRAFSFLLVTCTAIVVSTASAHGPQIQVTNTGGKITTRELIPEGSYGTALTAEKSVYVIPILKANSGSPSTDYWTVMPNSRIDSSLGVSAFQFGPGLAYGYGHTFEAGQHFNVNFTDPLKIWDSSGFVATLAGFDEEIAAFRGDNLSAADTAFTTDSGPFQGLVFSNISATYNAESHSSMRFRMLGDGASALVEPNDGIYLFRFQITSTQSALASSDVISLVLYKNATGGQLPAAVSSLGVDPSLIQYAAIPEPETALLALVSAASVLTLRRAARRGGA
jgi:hypothetical protein